MDRTIYISTMTGKAGDRSTRTHFNADMARSLPYENHGMLPAIRKAYAEGIITLLPDTVYMVILPIGPYGPRGCLMHLNDGKVEHYSVKQQTAPVNLTHWPPKR